MIFYNFTDKFTISIYYLLYNYYSPYIIKIYIPFLPVSIFWIFGE